MGYPKVNIGESRFINTNGHDIRIVRIPHYKLSKHFPSECDLYLFKSHAEMANRLDVLIKGMVYQIVFEYENSELAAWELGKQIKGEVG